MVAVCPRCFNRRWLPLPMERLPEEITWGTVDYYLQHEPDKFFEPCPECNVNGAWPFGFLPAEVITPWTDEPLNMAMLNPAFKKSLDKPQ